VNFWNAFQRTHGKSPEEWRDLNRSNKKGAKD
jgi:hypothetical protein